MLEMLRAPYSELTSLMQESRIAISSSALFLSDLSPTAGTPRHAKDELLARLSRNLSVCLHSDDPATWNFAHFIRHPDGRLTTTLVGKES